MSSDSEAEWPRLLRHAAHELRTPLGVGLGYLGFLLSSSDGPLTARQRQFVAESQKALGRLKTLTDEMSDLAKLETGEIKLQKQRIDIGKMLTEAVSRLPPADGRTIAIDITTSNDAGLLKGDFGRLSAAFTSIIFALRRELVTSDTLFIREDRRPFDGRPASWIAIGDAEQVERLCSATAERLTPFDESRGGSGLNLAIANKVLRAHGGAVWGPPGRAKAGGVIVLPGNTSTNQRTSSA
jgi:K+-sensing histidine kinase KdpD